MTEPIVSPEYDDHADVWNEYYRSSADESGRRAAAAAGISRGAAEAATIAEKAAGAERWSLAASVAAAIADTIMGGVADMVGRTDPEFTTDLGNLYYFATSAWARGDCVRIAALGACDAARRAAEETRATSEAGQRRRFGRGSGGGREGIAAANRAEAVANAGIDQLRLGVNPPDAPPPDVLLEAEGRLGESVSPDYPHASRGRE